MAENPAPNPEVAAPQPVTMDTIVALCKRKGFIFPSSEIYGGLTGFFDYGPLGVELKNNIKAAWWRDMVHRRDDMVGLDSTIIMHPKIWLASGHVENFTDPLVDCKESKMRYRADHLYFSEVVVAGETIGYISVLEDVGMEAEAQEKADTLKRKLQKQGKLEPLRLRDFTEAKDHEVPLVPSPATGKPGSLTPARTFNMMFQTNVGALTDASSVAYLRPETAQGIFVNFRNVVDTGRVKVPFGIAQIGKAFRNEITPRNFLFRSREFEQMEIEYFIPPDDDAWPRFHREWLDCRRAWHQSIGLPAELLSEYNHPKEKLSHYSRATTDIMFRFPHGVGELEGVAARGNFDLTQHQTHSGRPLDYFDEARKAKYVPHVIEPSVGVDRTFLAVLTAAYCEDVVEGEKRVMLKLHPRVAPYKAAVFPLLKNKPELVEAARKLHRQLQKRWLVFYDETAAIGRRYRRQDEVGTPFGITVDFDTLEKGSVTLRDRDTTTQIRLGLSEVEAYLAEKIEG